MNKKDSKWINGIGSYIFILEDINNKYFELTNSDFEIEKIENIFYLLSTQISRLIPTKYNKKKEKIELINDGILLLNEDIPYLKENYDKVFKTNLNTIESLNTIRNKYEHAPHIISCYEMGKSNDELNIKFRSTKYDFIRYEELSKDEILNLKEEKLYWDLNTDDLKNLINDLNNIYNKIIAKFVTYINDNNFDLSHPYLKKIYSKSFEIIK